MKDEALNLALEAWKWHQAPVKTSWGDEMVVADLAIDKDHTVSVYCERDQTAKVEAMFTTPAAPDLQAELDATNKQVEILSDALAESRREVAALKAVQEPVAWINAKEDMTYLHGPYNTDDRPLIYGDIPPAAQRPWVGLTDGEKRNICRVGPVYAPDGVITRNPLEYRKELEGVALMAVRQAEVELERKNT
jgi:hypothetical protein